MAIGAIEMQGQILRTQDYSTIKHQEDSRADINQANIQQTRQVEENRQFNRVSASSRTEDQQTNSDASDKGSNEYSGDGGRQRREARERRAADGKVFIKAVQKMN